MLMKVCQMEEVLEVYTRPYDPDHPVICFDESNKQLVSERIEPLPMQPDQPQRYDYQYQRNGVCNLFVFFEPLGDWRHIQVTQQRTAVDYAQQMKYLVDVLYPHVTPITVVQDQLNTHVAASLYKAFEPVEARRILDKLEFCYTPKHGSWLNMAEIELSVLSRQCLRERMESRESLQEQVTTWEEKRNRHATKVDWRFITADARTKLKRLYPSILPSRSTRVGSARRRCGINPCPALLLARGKGEIRLFRLILRET
jgi:hypothetical protein